LRTLRLRLYGYRLPLRSPVVTAARILAERRGVLVRLEADDGGAGWGEAAPLPGWSTSTVAGDVVALTAWDGRHLAGLSETARAAVEGALVDLASRRAGVAEARALAPDAASAVAVNALVTAMSPSDVEAAAGGAVAAGHSAIKLKVGGRSLAEDLARVRAAVAAAPGVELRLDANGAWSLAEAVEAMEALRPFEIAFVEQPVPDLAGMAALRRRGSVAIAADEAVTTASDLEAVIAAAAADIVVLKPSALGGPASALAMAHRAREAGLEVVVTSFMESAIGVAHALHVAAAVAPDRAAGLATATLLATDVADPVPLEGGEMVVPSPGLGISPGGAGFARRLATDLPEGGAGQVVHPLDGPWGAEGRELGADVVAQLLETGGGGPIGGDGHRGDALAPLGIGPTHDGHGGDAPVPGQHGLHCCWPHVLAPGHDHLAAPAEHPQAPVGSELAGIAGRQPASRQLGVRTVAVGPQQHRTSHLHLAVYDADLDAVERLALVDDAAAGLGQPVGGQHVRRALSRGSRAAHEDDPEQGGVDPGQGRGHQRHEGRPPSGCGADGDRVEAIVHLDGNPGVDRTGHHGEATHVAERQAGQPAVGVRFGRQAPAGGQGGGPDRIVGQDHPLGLARGAAGGDHQRVAVVGGQAARPLVDAIGPHDHVGGQSVQQALPGRRREPQIDGQHRVAGIPDPLQLVDEARPAGPRQRYQPPHRSGPPR